MDALISNIFEGSSQNNAKIAENAFALKDSGKYREALTAFSIAQVFDPKNANLFAAFAHCVRLLGNKAEAASIFERLREQFGNHREIIWGWSESYWEMGDWDRALSSLETEPNLFKIDPYFVMRRSQILRMKSQTKRAAEETRTLIEGHNWHPDITKEYIETLVILKRHDEILHALEKSIAAHPRDEELQYIRLKHTPNNEDEITSLLDELSSSTKNHSNKFIKLIKILSARKNPTATLPHFEKYLLTHADLSVLSEYAHAALSSKKFKLSEDLYSKALDISEKTSDLLTGYATTLHANGKPREAIDALKEASKINRENIHTLYQISEIQAELGNYQDALETIDRILQSSPEVFYVWHEKSIIHSHANQHKDAASAALKSFALNPTFRWGIHTLVTSLRAANMKLDLFDVLKKYQWMAQSSNDTERASYLDLIAKSFIIYPDIDCIDVIGTAETILKNTKSDIPLETLWALCEKSSNTTLYNSLEKALLGAIEEKSLSAWDGYRILLSIMQNGETYIDRSIGLLSAAMPAEQSAHFELEAAYWAGRSEHGIKNRKRDNPIKSANYIECLSRLLVQVGKTKTASRYQIFCNKRAPQSPQNFKSSVHSLIKCGDRHRALSLLQDKIDNLNYLPSDWLNAIGELAINLDDIDASKKAFLMLENIGHTNFGWCLDLLMREGNFKGFVQKCENIEQEGFNPHSSPTLNGVLKLEAHLSTMPDQTGYSTTPLAITKINTHKNSPANPDKDLSSTHLVQYWDKSPPPKGVADISKSWDASFANRKLMLNRATSLDFLQKNFPEDWSRAFKNAKSPAEESDFIRLAYLSKMGGIYVDADDCLTERPDLNLINDTDNLIVFREPRGSIANNIICAPKGHPAIAIAAIMAKNALLRGDNDNVWTKTGPGLLTRAIALHILRCEEKEESTRLIIHPICELGKTVSYHTQLAYKVTPKYWNATKKSSRMSDLSMRVLFGA